jgi:hypothetical protein
MFILIITIYTVIALFNNMIPIVIIVCNYSLEIAEIEDFLLKVDSVQNQIIILKTFIIVNTRLKKDFENLLLSIG